MGTKPGPEIAELLSLAVFLLATPPVIILMRRLRQRSGLAFLYAAFLAILTAHVLSVTEHFTIIEPLFDMTQHLLYGVAGVLAATP
jgi:hypothetical protein